MNYTPLQPEDFNTCKPFFRKQRYRLCVYSLSSLIAWSNELYRPFISILEDTLVVYVKSGITDEKNYIIMPISPERSFRPKELAVLAGQYRCNQIRFVPEGYVQSTGEEQIRSSFFLYEESEYEDYIYRTADLAELKGNRYSKKRNLINQFVRDYVKYDRVIVEPITESSAEDCIAFLEQWCEERGCEDMEKQDDLACEKEAILQAVEHIDQLEMDGILLRVDGIVSAFGIASHLTRKIGVLHFEKAFAAIKGLYQYFDRECAQRLFARYTYINKESDMGIPGLAKAKRSYHPVSREKSYRLVVK